MNPQLELSIRESVAVTTGILHHEINDYFDSSNETEKARSVFLKLLIEFELARMNQLCVRYNIQINKMREYIDKADEKIYDKCKSWIKKITSKDYGKQN